MRISVRHQPVDEYAGHIVATALVRSFTTAQVGFGGDANNQLDCAVWINPPSEAASEIEELLRAGGKAIVFGRLEPSVADVLSLDSYGQIDLPPEWAECSFDPHSHHDASPAAIRYLGSHWLARQSPLTERPLCRFDFSNEWNNLGFGRIRLDRGPWSVQTAAGAGNATTLAELAVPDGRALVYAALWDTPRGSGLWFNRPVGPVDSLEWQVIESFLGDYRAEELPCFPYVSEVPAGRSGVVCARLDCDEAVGSARPLWELYQSYDVPLSIALPTGLSLVDRDLQLLRDVIAARGSVVSHSVCHLPNWGGCYQLASAEAAGSKTWLEENFPAAAPVRYAASPFHQNPTYAVRALADCRYDGFVSGIIGNDPEYLLGRAGRVPFSPRPLVSFSSQCMLHGDCCRRYGHSIDTYERTFDDHHAGRAIFGYLDHPFSDRYQYGWNDERARLTAHQQLIEHISRQPGVWWASLSDALDFLRRRDLALVSADVGDSLRVEVSPDGGQPLAIHWKGRQHAY